MSRACGWDASSALIAASESGAAQDDRLAAALGAADARQRLELVDVDAGQRRADRARADHRLDLGRGPVGDDRAVRHQHRAIGVRVGLLEVVRGEHDRLAARGEGAHRRPERVAPLDVERDGRLVEHEQLRVADERDGEAHALGLAAGELLGALIGDLADAGELERLLDVERRGYSEAIIATSSRTDRSLISAPVCSMPPTAPWATACAGGRPNTDTLPSSGSSRPSSMSIVVDLPAPLGPSSATVSPAAICTSMPRTARIGPSGPRKDLTRPRSWISLVDPAGTPSSERTLTCARCARPSAGPAWRARPCACAPTPASPRPPRPRARTRAPRRASACGGRPGARARRRSRSACW